jgi:hypothetical protein
MMVKKQLSAEVEKVFEENYAASWWQADYTSHCTLNCILDCTPN